MGTPRLPRAPAGARPRPQGSSSALGARGPAAVGALACAPALCRPRTTGSPGAYSAPVTQALAGSRFRAPPQLRAPASSARVRGAAARNRPSLLWPDGGRAAFPPARARTRVRALAHLAPACTCMRLCHTRVKAPAAPRGRRVPLRKPQPHARAQTTHAGDAGARPPPGLRHARNVHGEPARLRLSARREQTAARSSQVGHSAPARGAACWPAWPGTCRPPRAPGPLRARLIVKRMGGRVRVCANTYYE